MPWPYSYLCIPIYVNDHTWYIVYALTPRSNNLDHPDHGKSLIKNNWLNKKSLIKNFHMGRRYIKLKNMWLEADGSVDKVRLWRSSYQFTGTPSFILASKLKAYKYDFKKWKVEIFGNDESQKNSFWFEYKNSLISSHPNTKNTITLQFQVFKFFI